MAIALLLAASAAPQTQASQLVLKSTGGTMTLGTDFKVLGASVANPAGTVSIDCPITATYYGTYAITYDCSGGSFTFQPSAGATSVSASFSTGKLTLTASGGGRGGNIKYYYAFSGNFSGVETVNAVSGVVNGQTTENIGPLTAQIGSGSATACCGEAGITSAYTPIYVTDYSFSQLVRSDDLWGTNKQVLGSTGSGQYQFYGPQGVTVDKLGRIYVVDLYNCRIVRVSDITGSGWTTFGGCGSGINQFKGATDIALDSLGRIYVADSGNNRIVRFDDMHGTHWTALGSSGSGTNQFIVPQGVAIDSSGRIYIADTDNRRLVRMDDMKGTNWTSLTQSPSINGYVYSFGAPAHVTFDPSGRIVVGDGSSAIRVDDMSGANWTTLNLGTAVQGLSVDPSGTTFVAGSTASGGPGLALFDDLASGAGFATSNMVGQTGGIYAVPVPSAVPAVTLAPSSLTFGSQNVGTQSPAQNVGLTNFGSAPLDLSNIVTSTGFVTTDNCGATLDAGSHCTISVSFAPTAAGSEAGVLTISDNAFTGTQKVALSGTATAPAAAIAPASLTFAPQLINTTSSLQTVFLSNTGSGALTFSGPGIAVSGDFAQSNNCGSSLAPKTSCAIAIKFTPTGGGNRTGTLSVTGIGAAASASLSGTGASSPPAVVLSPQDLIFSAELLRTASPAQTVTLTNSGSGPISIRGIALSKGFERTGACPRRLGPGSSCAINVSFIPKTAGIHKGALTFKLSRGAVSTALIGTAVSTAAGWLTLSTDSLTFSGYAVGDNPSQAVNLTNTTGVPAGIGSTGMSGSNAFTESSTCGNSVPGYGSCSVTITFMPTVAGTFSATLAILESAGIVHQVSLNGSASTNGN